MAATSPARERSRFTRTLRSQLISRTHMKTISTLSPTPFVKLGGFQPGFHLQDHGRRGPVASPPSAVPRLFVGREGLCAAKNLAGCISVSALHRDSEPVADRCDLGGYVLQSERAPGHVAAVGCTEVAEVLVDELLEPL